MDSGWVLALFLLSQVLSFSTQEQSKQGDAACPPNFPCRNLTLKFPFTDFRNQNCGLCMVDCSNSSKPRIALRNPGEQWFLAESIGPSTMTLQSEFLQTFLPQRNCNSFYYDINLPNSPSISFTFLKNITLFRCHKNKNSKTNPNLNNSFLPKGFGYYGGCQDFIYYYKYLNDSPPNVPIGPTCSIVYLPVNKSFSLHNNESDDVFRLLGSEFELEWHVSDECFECHDRGDLCRTTWSSESPCVSAEENSSGTEKKKLGVILGSVGAAFILLSFAVLLIIWRRKKGINAFPYFKSRTLSKADLEDGSVLGVSVFSYSELGEATKNFDASKELGDGGFGTVYYGKLRDGREVAVKRLYEHNFKRMEQFRNEVQILTGLRHPNLVTLYGCTSKHSRELLLVYEYIPNGTVADHLHGDKAKNKYLTWPHRMNIAIETAAALAYLHASEIVHRDVKTTNILLDHNFGVKVADFGLSRLFPSDVTHISTAPQGTPGYVDPEYHQCYQLTDKSDVYSFGVVLIELISSMPAVDISRHRHEINLANLAINRIQRCAFDDLIDPSLGYKSDPEVMRMTTSVAELAFQCLQGEKEMRPTMEEVLQTLKDIQNFKETSNEDTSDAKEQEVNETTTSNPSVSFSPEAEDRVLLKNAKFASSPISVTTMWHSISSRGGRVIWRGRAPDP